MIILHGQDLSDNKTNKPKAYLLAVYFLKFSTFGNMSIIVIEDKHLFLDTKYARRESGEKT